MKLGNERNFSPQLRNFDFPKIRGCVYDRHTFTASSSDRIKNASMFQHTGICEIVARFPA
jgi:hypothetical protein